VVPESPADAGTSEKKEITARVSAMSRRASRGAHNALAGADAIDAPNKNWGNHLGQTIAERAGDEPDLLPKLFSEFIGTFFLVFTVGVSTQSGSAPFAPVAIGLVLGIQIYCYGSISGGMFNPAVTIAVLLSGRSKIHPKTAALDICVQFLGGGTAGLFAYAVTDKTFCFDWEANPYGGSGVSLLLETIYTAALCLTVLTAGTSWDVPNEYYGFAIGMTVTASAYACGGFDQGSFNPAVTFGINFANAVNAGRPSMACEIGPWLLFLFAPFLGSFLAVGVFRGTRVREYSEGLEDIELKEKLLAEFTGTFFLVFTVCVAVCGGSSFAALAIGLMLSVQVYTFARVSGACLNPAVTLAVFFSGRGKMDAKTTASYIGIQFFAGIFAGFLAFGVTDPKTFYFDQELTEKAGGMGSSFILEALCTSVLCMTVLTTGTSKDAPNQYYGFAIGCAVLASAVTCGDFNQGSFNPAVTAGANFANYANDKTSNPSAGAFFLFLLTPFCGSALAAGAFVATRQREFQEFNGARMSGIPIAENVKGGKIGKGTVDTE